MPNITIDDLADSFGTTAEDIKEKCSDLMKDMDLNYSTIEGEELDELILRILKRIDSDTQIIGAPGRKQVWDEGWSENLKNFVESNYNLKTLVPKFIRAGQPVRFKLKYIKPSNPDFELDYYSLFRQWLFKKYFSDCDHIYEFGCGTGFNLVALAQLYPDKNLYGLDFVPSSVELVNKIAGHHKYNIRGYLFDMLHPDKEFNLQNGSTVLTIGSVEQLASNFEPFIKYLVSQPISLCIHVEPAIELYDENKLVDYLAIKFQGKRGYTRNLLPYLKKLESEKIIEILEIKRLFFGSLFMEGYNCMIWRPLENKE